MTLEGVPIVILGVVESMETVKSWSSSKLSSSIVGIDAHADVPVRLSGPNVTLKRLGVMKSIPLTVKINGKSTCIEVRVC